MMSVNNIKQSFLRNILLVIAVFAFAVVIFGGRGEIYQTWELLKKVDIRQAALLPLISLTSYFFISGYYRSLIGAFGKNISRWRAFGTTAALNFVNQVLPSGGASGTTYLIYAFKDKASSGKLTLIQIGRYVLAFLTYVPLLVTAFIWLKLNGQLNDQMTIILAVLMSISLPGMVLLLLAIRNEKMVDAIVEKTLRLLNRVIRFFTRKDRGPIKLDSRHGFLKEFHDGISFIHSQGHQVVKPYLFMQMSTLAEVSLVSFAFHIVGANVSPPVILVAFTAANVAGAISVIPGDVGVHELAVITVLSYVGIDQSIALAGTLLYRVFNKFIVMGFGFSMYVRFIKPLINNANSHA